jgi:hypothetical protein
MINHDRYIKAARAKFEGDGDICVEDGDVDTVTDSEGAWVNARIFVRDHEVEPTSGPTYDVWIGEFGLLDGLDMEILDPTTPAWIWAFDQSFTCEDDPDGVGARRSAHTYARHLRNTYPCAFVAVRPSGKRPLQIKHFTESSPHA